MGSERIHLCHVMFTEDMIIFWLGYEDSLINLLAKC